MLLQGGATMLLFFLPLTQLTSVTKDDHGCADMHHRILMMHGTAQCHDTRVQR